MTAAEAAIATGLIVVAPGPALAVSVSSAIDGGRRGGVLAISGLAAGIILHAFVAAVGLAVVFASHPGVQGGLQAAGALFLATVGVRMILRGLRSDASPARRPGSVERSAYVARGLFTNVLNPWILGFYVSMVPVFAADGARSAFLAAAVVAGIHVAQLALWHGLVGVAISAGATLYESRGHILRVVAGAGLVAVASWFMFR